MTSTKSIRGSFVTLTFLVDNKDPDCPFCERPESMALTVIIGLVHIRECRACTLIVGFRIDDDDIDNTYGVKAKVIKTGIV